MPSPPRLLRWPERSRKNVAALPGRRNRYVLALAELERYLGKLPTPAFHVLRRWPRSLPQYAVSHLDQVAEIETLTATLPRPPSPRQCLPRSRPPGSHPPGPRHRPHPHSRAQPPVDSRNPKSGPNFNRSKTLRKNRGRGPNPNQNLKKGCAQQLSGNLVVQSDVARRMDMKISNLKATAAKVLTVGLLGAAVAIAAPSKADAQVAFRRTLRPRTGLRARLLRPSPLRRPRTAITAMAMPPATSTTTATTAATGARNPGGLTQRGAKPGSPVCVTRAGSSGFRGWRRPGRRSDR